MVDPICFEAASNRFRVFFDELHRVFLERDDLLLQLALALLSREHLLVTGPPGTAKSQLASTVFGRILDEETGNPSVYSRQIGESTVQTDLIGPIDFKTLMETGRTEHFTDEGMLGAVHAFLDEIFDGRDMLLRSALNVLQERELKQGGRVKRGRIECALMTSNRYIADVLEGSRETLLAFVDRLAFVAFVPRSFADPGRLGLVLRRHVGGTGRLTFEPMLSIQDLDALQQAVDDVYVSDPICDGLATFLEKLDRELNAAVRADPQFVPTRYISTRTAVRSGRVLRAAVVADRILNNPKRQLEVLPGDFKWLRFHLLLCGPSPADVEALLTRETDPNERRQLEIVRTERTIFDTCIHQMPVIVVKPRPVEAPKPAGPSFTDKPRGETQAQSKVVDKPRAVVDKALGSADVPTILAALRELSLMTREGALDSGRAPSLVSELTSSLGAMTLRRGLLAGATNDRGGIADVARSVMKQAAEIDEGSNATRSLARWLRGRALLMVDEAAGHAAGASSTDLIAWIVDDAAEAQKRAEARLAALEELEGLRRELLAQGAVHESGEENVWRQAALSAEDDIATLLDISFRAVVSRAMKSGRSRVLTEILAAIAPELDRIDALAKRLTVLRGEPSALKSKVAGRRIGPLIEAVFADFDATDRSALVREVESLTKLLRKSGLENAVSPENFLGWTAEALLRGDLRKSDPSDKADFDGYQRLRAAEQRVSSAYTLAEVSLIALPVFLPDLTNPAEAARAIASMCEKLPDSIQDKVVEGDLARINRALFLLERFWENLQSAGADTEARLRTIVESRFFDIVWDDSALTRFALEARLVADVFPKHEQAVAAVRGRIEALDQKTRDVVTELFRSRSDAQWSNSLRAK
jgi:MoxR-like ATPase